MNVPQQQLALVQLAAYGSSAAYRLATSQLQRSVGALLPVQRAGLLLYLAFLQPAVSHIRVRRECPAYTATVAQRAAHGTCAAAAACVGAANHLHSSEASWSAIAYWWMSSCVWHGCPWQQACNGVGSSAGPASSRYLRSIAALQQQQPPQQPTPQNLPASPVAAAH